MTSLRRLEIRSIPVHLRYRLLMPHLLLKVMNLLRKRLHQLLRFRGSNKIGLISWQLRCRVWLRMLMRDSTLLVHDSMPLMLLLLPSFPDWEINDFFFVSDAWSELLFMVYLICSRCFFLVICFNSSVLISLLFCQFFNKKGEIGILFIIVNPLLMMLMLMPCDLIFNFIDKYI